jgi:hypothetical protein
VRCCYYQIFVGVATGASHRKFVFVNENPKAPAATHVGKRVCVSFGFCNGEIEWRIKKENRGRLQIPSYNLAQQKIDFILEKGRLCGGITLESEFHQYFSR